MIAAADFLQQLREKEKAGGIMPDPDVDAYLKAAAVEGTRDSPVTHYIMRLLGLEANPLNLLALHSSLQFH